MVWYLSCELTGNLPRKLNSWHWKARRLYTTAPTCFLWNICRQKRGRSKRGNTLYWSPLKRSKFPVWIIYKGGVQNVFLAQQSLGSVKSLLTLKWTRRFYLWWLVTFSLFLHRWPWILSSLLVSGHQRLQRESCEHFGFATDHLTLGRPACGEL